MRNMRLYSASGFAALLTAATAFVAIGSIGSAQAQSSPNWFVPNQARPAAPPARPPAPRPRATAGAADAAGGTAAF